MRHWLIFISPEALAYYLIRRVRILGKQYFAQDVHFVIKSRPFFAIAQQVRIAIILMG
jgi:hypothetical protein